MSDVLNKKALSEILAEKTGMTKKDSVETVDIVFSTIAESLKNGNKVDISGFGKFEVKTREARNGINPKTKEAIKIAASKVPGFKAAKGLKDAVK